MDSTAAAIAAKGSTIPLHDGSEVTLRYSMLSLARLEEDFGDLSSIVAHVESAAKAVEARERLRTGTARDGDDTLAKSSAAIFTELMRVLLPGLLDASAVDPRTGDRVWLDGNDDVAMRVLDPRHLATYLNAFREAFTEAFDTGEQPKAGGAAHPPVADPPASRGRTGTTSRVGSRGGQTRSSGA